MDTGNKSDGIGVNVEREWVHAEGNATIVQTGVIDDVAQNIHQVLSNTAEMKQTLLWVSQEVLKDNQPCSYAGAKVRLWKTLDRFIGLSDPKEVRGIDANTYKILQDRFILHHFSEKIGLVLTCSIDMISDDTYKLRIRFIEVDKKGETKSFYEFPSFGTPLDGRFFDKIEILNTQSVLLDSRDENPKIKASMENFIEPKFESLDAGDNGGEHAIVIIPELRNASKPWERERYIKDIMGMLFFQRTVWSFDLFQQGKGNTVKYVVAREFFLTWVRAKESTWKDFLEYIGIQFLSKETRRDASWGTVVWGIVQRFFMDIFLGRVKEFTTPSDYKAEFKLNELTKKQQSQLREEIVRVLWLIVTEKLNELLKIKKMLKQ